MAHTTQQMVAAAGEKLLIVDYSTTWCGPCKMMAPKFDDMSNRYENAVRACVPRRHGIAWEADRPLDWAPSWACPANQPTNQPINQSFP